MQNSKLLLWLLRGMEGEGEGERDVEVPRQARQLTTPEYNYTKVNWYKVLAMHFKALLN